MANCLFCKQVIHKRYNRYCSNQCQLDYQYIQFVAAWKQGIKAGGVGIQAKRLSGHVIRYMREKYGEACTLCGWNKMHPRTGRVPLEIDHVDGDPENNAEANLRLICPNCHALTLNYRNLNRGNGRAWRRAKYIRSQSTPP